MKRPVRLAVALLAVFMAGIPPNGTAHAQDGGCVFIDANLNGVRDLGEEAVSGVVVTNGRELAVTGADGRYALSEGPDSLVYLTRPDGFAGDGWVRRGSGDFALVPSPLEGGDEGFFFIHMSDGHVWDRPEEVIRFLELERPWWLPRFVFGWFALRGIAGRIPADEATIAASLRAALALYYEGAVDDLWDSELLPTFLEEVLRPGSPLGDGERRVREAFAEITAFHPSFLVNTGDIVMDSTAVDPEVVARWMRLYREVSEQGGYRVYNSIGNHGLGGIHREDADPDGPDYGPGFFRKHFGPSYYSFDRGGFHFVALDTHHPPLISEEKEEADWRINRMRTEVATWLEADLTQHAGDVQVVLNHEPFRAEPTWPFPESFADENLVPDDALARHGVAYALTGHAHLRGVGEQNGVMSLHAGALSGLFWLMPQDLFPRGFRLIYARQGRLYSAWKDLGQPLLAVAEPPAPDGHLVVVAADRAGPLKGVRLELDGQPLVHERWGDFFLHARVPSSEVGRVVVTATTEQGETLRLP